MANVYRTPGLSTHVLDTALSAGAAGIRIILSLRGRAATTLVDVATTDTDGRAGFHTPEGLIAGTYELLFHVGPYLRQRHPAAPALLKEIPVWFRVTAPGEHHHVPLLVTPGGFSIYRGGRPPGIA